ncbi:DUF523 domain-containing protein [uncultured Roseobacter sp.]|uniref:DUF523 domain-containing protein n=1 Tax=uncultured Roseobacter sp. TaxID=114847 RepID=UPI00260B4CF7|nr:DUF523 domain-containing protein [uncultured Roseobacter sp.]
MQRILVSACLLGQPVRYDGSAKTVTDALLERWRQEGRLVPLCPEVGAGFPTPRPPAEIETAGGGAAVLAGEARILENTGRDVTGTFVRGAELAVRHARQAGCAFALLTDGSPSCGSTFIYSGALDGVRRAGQGVVTAALEAAGIRVFAPAQIADLAEALA